jgi:hypothetical protein
VTGTGAFTITATPASDNLYLSSPFTFRLKIVLASYTSRIGYISFTVNVNRYTCVASGTSATVYTASGALTSPYAYTIGST